MSENYLYVHLETVTNMILSYGIDVSDFVNSFKHVPEHLLLLSPVDKDEMIDPHTGFNVISGREDVLRYLLNQKITDKKWIDYKHTLYLDEITPIEISELLYLGHAYTHLSSPFYYKLENQYVYLSLPNQLTKVYYRQLTEFQRVLSNAIIRCFEHHNFDTNFWFRRHSVNYVALDAGTTQQLHTFLIEGALFNFLQATRQNQLVQVPIYLLKRRFIATDVTWSQDGQVLAGYLQYNRETQRWFVKENSK